MGDFRGFKLAEIEKDRPDLRDSIYTPSLRPLPRCLDPPSELRPVISSLVRDQLKENSGDFQSSCAAQALCSVIDILRIRDGGWAWDFRNPKVSAEMLYRCAREIEAAERGKNAPMEGLRSLRSAIKAVYHNGVCTELEWADNDEVGRARCARNIPLGAYYRLRSVLNDYHAALNDVGAIYAVAEIHDGWSPNSVSSKKGQITIESSGSAVAGQHAFVIIGYDEEGFLILNSWGASWGGYRQWPGVAHWSYRDWAERIVDGWVLRLGVPTPGSFEFSIGEVGLGGFLSGSISIASPPRYDLIGHYIHLDDGCFVNTGAFPSDVNSIKTTVALLNRRAGANSQPEERDGRAYTKLLLWIAGGDESTNEAVTAATAKKPYWKQQGVYPLTVLWCSDFFESTQPVLGQIFQTAYEKIGTLGPDLNRQIEISTRRIGRAFWRDLKDSARRAAQKTDSQIKRGSGMYAAFKELLELKSAIQIHVVAEGAGAILIGELIRTLDENGEEPSISRITTLTLLAPACTRAQFEQELLKWQQRRNRPILLLVPAKDTEMKIGFYQGSVLDLVERSFEEEVEEGRVPSKIMGTAGGAADAEKQMKDAMRVRRLKAPETSKSIAKLRSVTFSDDAFRKIIEYWTECDSMLPADESNAKDKSGGLDGQESKVGVGNSKRRGHHPSGQDRSRIPPQEAR